MCTDQDSCIFVVIILDIPLKFILIIIDICLISKTVWKHCINKISKCVVLYVSRDESRFVALFVATVCGFTHFANIYIGFCTF